MADSQNKIELQKRITNIHRAAEERDAERRAKRLDLPYIDLRKTPISIEAVGVISKKNATTGKLIPLQVKDHEIALACFNSSLPESRAIIQNLQDAHYTPRLFITSMTGITEAFHYYEFIGLKSKNLTGKIEIGSDDSPKKEDQDISNVKMASDRLKSMDFSETPTSDLLEFILSAAITTKASDIHFEVQEKNARIRYRIDGILHDISDDFPMKNYHSLVGKIKLLSNLKMNIKEEAQDGRFTTSLHQKDVEVRVSVIPSEFGETIVMRILDPGAINIGLSELGIRADDLQIVKQELAKPNGLVLNTGPTGSGKTTTLYSFLKSQVSSETKIITIEDPIEYRVDGIEQTQTNKDSGYTFAKGLRAIVRQDPDIILIGEIRDLETADIALEASLTGHMVFSTMHTNDAIGAVPRLIDLGVRSQVIGPGLSLVIAQRLVRKLCSDCKQEQKLPPETQAKIKNFVDQLPSRVDKPKYATPRVFQATGCDICNGSGYRGRMAIFEFFRGGPDLERLILKEASEIALWELAKKQEMVIMQEDGMLKVVSGITTVEEVESATGPVGWWRD